MIGEDTGSSTERKEIRACIDLGSSFFRLLVLEGIFPPEGRYERGGLKIVRAREERCYVGWGEDLSISASVSPASVERARGALSRLVAAARSFGCPGPLLVGTNTLREARNAGDVVSRLEREFSLPISILSQRDEARLGYLGSAVFCASDERLVVLDVGGRSTQISCGRGIVMEAYRGLPLGTHRVRHICGRRAYSPAGLRRGLATLAGAIDALTRSSEDSLLPLDAEHSTILFTGGTAVSCVVCLRFMRNRRPLYEELYPLAIDDVVLLRRRLTALAMFGRERRMPLEANRMRLLPAGLVLVEALLRRVRVTSVRVTARDLRWGVAIGGKEWLLHEQTRSHR
jgi:exopolyphosphatase/guanosine-5'-triphosphate,3'-diphosphate pyrophosphatase